MFKGRLRKEHQIESSDQTCYDLKSTSLFFCCYSHVHGYLVANRMEALTLILVLIILLRIIILVSTSVSISRILGNTKLMVLKTTKLLKREKPCQLQGFISLLRMIPTKRSLCLAKMERLCGTVFILQV